MESKKTISKTSAVVMTLLILFLCVQFIYSEDKDNPPLEEGIFLLKYRGIDSSDEELRINSWYGYASFFGPFTEGNAPPLSDFAKSLNLKADKIEYIQNPNFKKSDYAVIEYQNNAPVALYIDLNANGKLDEGEKILPITRKDSQDIDFLTPNFEMQSSDGKKYPYRYIIRSRGLGSTMWGSSCVWEGKGKIEGKPYRIVLFDGSQDGDFTQFGNDSCMITPDEPKKNVSYNRTILSRIINLNNQFYKLNFSDDKTRLNIQKYTTPLGFLKTSFFAKSDMNIRNLYLTLNGATDSEVNFNIHPEISKTEKLPAMAYKLGNCSVEYGPQEREKGWRLYFQGSNPLFEIKADNTTELVLGEPKMKAQAIDKNNRYRNPDKFETVYKKGATVYISREIKGKLGEKYGLFVQGNNWQEVEPQVIIKDKTGKQVYSGSMQFGGGSCGFSWKTQDVNTGDYIIDVTQDTGALAGILKDTLTITIE